MKATVLLLLSITGAACGSEPSCDQIVDHVIELTKSQPPDRTQAIGECTKLNLSSAARRCMMKASHPGELGACMAVSADPALAVDKYSDYMKKSKRSEAKVMTHQLVNRVEMFRAENGTFPPQSAGPTPPVGACCKQPEGKCQPDPSLWATPAWQALDFSIDDPHYDSYWYEVKDPNREVIIHAIGDLDCDGLTSDLAVHMTPGGRTETSSNEDE